MLARRCWLRPAHDKAERAPPMRGEEFAQSLGLGVGDTLIPRHVGNVGYLLFVVGRGFVGFADLLQEASRVLLRAFLGFSPSFAHNGAK